MTYFGNENKNFPIPSNKPSEAKIFGLEPRNFQDWLKSYAQKHTYALNEERSKTFDAFGIFSFTLLVCFVNYLL